MKTRGLTLIELMAVIVVAAALLLLGTRQYQQMQETRRVEALRTVALQAKSAVQAYYNSYCNDLITDFVAVNIPRAGISRTGLKLSYDQVTTLSGGFTGLTFPYTVPTAISMPALGQIKSAKGEVTLYLALWVPYTDVNTLNALQAKLGVTSYGQTYPNNGGQVNQGTLLVWSWSATQEAAMVDNVRMGFGAQANAAFVKMNVPTFKALQAESAAAANGKIKLDKMSCPLVPAWLQAANS